jgi:hypothetical protein
LYSIYIEEQLNLAILSKEDEQESSAISTQRTQRLSRWGVVLDHRTSTQTKLQYEQEKTDKLGDLMNQL